MAEDYIDLPVKLYTGQCLAVTYAHYYKRGEEQRTNNVKAILEIDEVLEDHYLGTWTYTSLEKGGEQITAYDEGAADILLGVPVKFQASLNGRVERVIDKDGYLTRLLASSLFEEMEHKQKSKVFDLLYNLTDVGLAQHILKVPSILAICQDTCLKLGEPVRAENETQSTFGNGSFLTYTTYVSKGIDAENGHAVIEFTSEADPEGLSSVVLDFLSQNSPETVFSSDDMKKIRSVQHSHYCKAWIDLNTGTALKVMFKKVIDFPGNPPRLDDYKIFVSLTG